MTGTPIVRLVAIAGAVTTLMLASPAVHAQGTPAAPDGSPSAQVTAAQSGPLVVERVRDRYVIAPEARVTELDGEAAALVGGYGGLLLQGSVLVGGAVYTMPDGPNSSELTYGGLLLGLVFGDDRRFTYGVRGLVGVGNGELTSSIRFGVPTRPTPKFQPPGSSVPGPTVVRDVQFEETFMVLEPQAEVALRLSDNWRIAFGAGYRFTNASDYFDDRFNGATGSVAIVFGGGR